MWKFLLPQSRFQALHHCPPPVFLLPKIWHLPRSCRHLSVSWRASIDSQSKKQISAYNFVESVICRQQNQGTKTEKKTWSRLWGNNSFHTSKYWFVELSEHWMQSHSWDTATWNWKRNQYTMSTSITTYKQEIRPSLLEITNCRPW